MVEPVMARRTAWLLGILGGVSLLAGFAALIFGAPVLTQPSIRADSYSRSAIGHRAFHELLQRPGRQVVRSRAHSVAKVDEGTLLLVIEPEPEGERIQQMVRRAGACLVVLPEHTGRRHSKRPDWIGSAGRVALETAQECLEAAGSDGTVVRPEGSGAWRTGGFDIEPDLVDPQLVRRSGGAAAIESDEGALLFELWPGQPVSHWVLSDPDLLSNHGIGRGDNAELVLRIVDRIAPGARTVVIDETLHGHEVPSNIWAELGRFPLVLVLVQSLVVIVVLVWSGAVRFGRAEEIDTGLAPGKTVLIDNTAGLLLRGGHSPSVLPRYLDLSEQRVAAAFRLPAGSSPEERAERLRRLGSVRRVEPDLDTVREQVGEATAATHGVEHRMLHAARNVRQWTMEMLDGDR